MRPTVLPLAILALFGIVAMIPAVAYFVTGPPAGALSTQAQVLAGLSVPLIVLLFLASHLQPGGGA